MSNVVRNSRFETDAYWSLTAPATISTLFAYEGRSLGCGSASPTGKADQTLANLTTGEVYRVKMQASWNAGPDPAELWIDPGDGNLALVASLAQPHQGARSWGLWVAYEFTALGSTGAISIRCNADSFPGSSSLWRFDNVEVGLSKTIAIRDAIVDDMETITTGNGYSVTVGAVYTEPTELEQRNTTAIQIMPTEGGESDPLSLTNRAGDAVQTFGFEANIQAADPITAAANFLDDIRNAIEVSTSNTVGLSGVDSVTVNEWSAVSTTDDIHNLQGIFSGQITVRYQYTRGSV